MKHNGFESSMTDLMISLVVLFLLIISIVVLQMNKAQNAPVTRVNDLMQILKKELDIKTQELHIDGLVIERSQDDNLAFIVIVPEKSLKFDYNSFILNLENKKFLNNIMPIIAQVTEEHSKDIDFIKIEGYTDQSGGIDGMGNILLSQNRALSVLNYTLQSILYGNTRLFFLDKTSISGYGSLSKYLQNNDENSRRVIIKVRVKSVELYKQFDSNRTKTISTNE